MTFKIAAVIVTVKLAHPVNFFSSQASLTFSLNAIVFSFHYSISFLFFLHSSFHHLLHFRNVPLFFSVIIFLKNQSISLFMSPKHQICIHELTNKINTEKHFYYTSPKIKDFLFWLSCNFIWMQLRLDN